MDPKLKRLNKLLAVHGQLKALHETRRAAHLARAREAEAEAEGLIRRFDAEDSMSGLFPELYHARIKSAWTRGAEQRDLAEAEEAKLASLSLREKRIGEERDRLRAALERLAGERAALDWVEMRAVREA